MGMANFKGRSHRQFFLFAVVTLFLASPTVFASPQQGTSASVGGPRELQPTSLRLRETMQNGPVVPARNVEPTGGIVKNNMLTYRAKNQPLRSVLEEIGDAAGVAIVLGQDLGEEQVSVEFKDYRLDEALRQLLRDYDVFFFYGVQKESEPAGLKTVWVYPSNRGQGLKPEPPEAWASTLEAERMLANGNPEVRARAIETLIERKQEQSLHLVLKALRDESELVRTRTLDEALSTDLEIPEQFLIELALNDRSIDVRFLALEALSEDPGPGLRWVAERSVQDPSEHIRKTARAILRQLDAAGRSGNQQIRDKQKSPDEQQAKNDGATSFGEVRERKSPGKDLK